jgi:hypothetical protein
MCNADAGRNVLFQVFLVAPEPIRADTNTQAFGGKLKRNMTVLSIRSKAGFGGVITVGAVLLAVQFITGVQAFPL